MPFILLWSRKQVELFEVEDDNIIFHMSIRHSTSTYMTQNKKNLIRFTLNVFISTKLGLILKGVSFAFFAYPVISDGPLKSALSEFNCTVSPIIPLKKQSICLFAFILKLVCFVFSF